MTLNSRLVLAVLLLCLGCNVKSQSNDHTKDRSPEMSKNTEQQSMIQGSVSRVGVSRVKTLAAWHGVPPPHPFIVVKLAPGRRAHRISDGEVYVWFPGGIPQSEVDRLVNAQVQLLGQWVDPPPRAPVDLHQPEQRPIEHVMMIDVQHPIALASEVDEVKPAASEPSTAPATQEVKDQDVDKVWVPVDRQAHFQASKVTLLK